MRKGEKREDYEEESFKEQKENGKREMKWVRWEWCRVSKKGGKDRGLNIDIIYRLSVKLKNSRRVEGTSYNTHLQREEGEK